MSGIGNHYGGSCQVGFSTDGGNTFHVVTSYEGNCPHRNNGDGPQGQDFDFTVPADLPAGVQLFAWIWYNREQEFNMNCAAVEIIAGQDNVPPSSSAAASATQNSSIAPTAYSSTADATISPEALSSSFQTANDCSCQCPSPVNIATRICQCPSSEVTKSTNNRARHLARHLHGRSSSSAMAFHDRPLMLVADMGNDCHTPRTVAEVKFPNPGPDVVTGDGVYPLQYPTGNCS
jgi:hypothetical protein